MTGTFIELSINLIKDRTEIQKNNKQTNLKNGNKYEISLLNIKTSYQTDWYAEIIFFHTFRCL